MSTDRFDEMFTQMMNNLRRMFGNNFLTALNHQFDDITNEATEKEKEDECTSSPDTKSTFFGYEIVSGSDLKEPMIRVYGNPDDFPNLKESMERMFSGLPGSFKSEEIMIPLNEPLSEDPEVIEPFTETYSREDIFVATLDLPGVGENDLTVTVDGTVLTIDARSEARHFKKEIQLGFFPEQADIHYAMNNGLLEVTIKTSKQQ